jgi:hypothetical protein
MMGWLLLAGLGALALTQKKEPGSPPPPTEETLVPGRVCEFWIDVGYSDPSPMSKWHRNVSDDPHINIETLRELGDFGTELQLRCSDGGAPATIEQRWTPGSRTARHAPPGAQPNSYRYWVTLADEQGATAGRHIGAGSLAWAGTADEDALIAHVWATTPGSTGYVFRITEDFDGNQVGPFEMTHTWERNEAPRRAEQKG